jgi:hypothetical protein
MAKGYTTIIGGSNQEQCKSTEPEKTTNSNHKSMRIGIHCILGLTAVAGLDPEESALLAECHIPQQE